MKMKKSTWGTLVVLLLLACGWLLSEIRWGRVNDPHGKFATASEYLAAGRAPSRVVRVQKDNAAFLVAYGPKDTWLAIPSGPAAYVFDRNGKLIDWTWDSGDDPGFQSRWTQRGSESTTVVELESLGGKQPSSLPDLPS